MTDTKLKVVPHFPPDATATAGIRLDKDKAEYKFSIDHDTFGSIPGSQPNQTLLVWNGTSYFRVPLT